MIGRRPDRAGRMRSPRDAEIVDQERALVGDLGGPSRLIECHAQGRERARFAASTTLRTTNVRPSNRSGTGETAHSGR